MLDGSTKNLTDFEGKVVMVVNVASRCGLSPQYEARSSIRFLQAGTQGRTGDW